MRAEGIGYLECITSPENFKINRIIATTHSLEPAMVHKLACILNQDSISSYNEERALKKCIANNSHDITLKKHINKESNKLTIYYQNDKFNYDKESIDDNLLALIRHTCIKKSIKNASFNPRIILVEYKSNHNDLNNNGAIKHKDIKNNEYIYRLIMPSADLINKHFESKAVTLEYKSKKRLKLGNRLSKLVEFINDPSNNWIVKDSANATARVYFAYKNKIQLYKEMELDSSNQCIMALQKGSIAKDSTVDFQRCSKNTKFYMTKEPCSNMYCITNEGRSKLWIGSARGTTKSLGLNDESDELSKDGLFHVNSECMVCFEYNNDVSKEFVQWLEGNNFERYYENSVNEFVGDTQEEKVESFINQSKFKCNVVRKDGAYDVIFNIKYHSNLDVENIEVCMAGDFDYREVCTEIRYENVPIHKVANMLAIRLRGENWVIERLICTKINRGTKNALNEGTRAIFSYE